MPGLSDAELKTRLETHNCEVPPITPTTRRVLQKKLAQLDGDNQKSSSTSLDDDFAESPLWAKQGKSLLAQRQVSQDMEISASSDTLVGDTISHLPSEVSEISLPEKIKAQEGQNSFAQASQYSEISTSDAHEGERIAHLPPKVNETVQLEKISSAQQGHKSLAQPPQGMENSASSDAVVGEQIAHLPLKASKTLQPKKINSVEGQKSVSENMPDVNIPQDFTFIWQKKSLYEIARKYPNYHQFKLQNFPTFIINTKEPSQQWKRKEDEVKNEDLYIQVDDLPARDDNFSREQTRELVPNIQVYDQLPDDDFQDDWPSHDDNFLRRQTKTTKMKMKSSPNEDDFAALCEHTERHKLMNVEDESDDAWDAGDNNKRKKHNKGKQPVKSASRNKSPVPVRSSSRLQVSKANGPIQSTNSSEGPSLQKPMCPMCHCSFAQNEIEDHAATCLGTQHYAHDEAEKICPICQKAPNLKIRTFEEHVDVCCSKGDKGTKDWNRIFMN